MSEAYLYARFGEPDSIKHIDNNNKVYTYNSKNFNPELYSSLGFRIKNGSSGINTNIPAVAADVMTYAHAMHDEEANEQVFYDKCVTNFVINRGMVVSYGFQGDGCGKTSRY